MVKPDSMAPIEPPVTNVDYVCPGCLMIVKPPVTQEVAVTWVEGVTRYYAHRRCDEEHQIVSKRRGG